MDGTLYPLARALLDELSRLLNFTRAGHPDYAVVHPGNTVPQYGCSLAAVRVANIIPAPGNTVRGGLCGNTNIVAVLEMTVDRCYATPPDNSMPTLAVLDSYSRDLADDAAAMRTAAQCFRGTTPPAPLLGAWTPRGPAGGIFGGATLVQVTIDPGCGCGTPDDAWPDVDTLIPPLPGDPRHP